MADYERFDIEEPKKHSHAKKSWWMDNDDWNQVQSVETLWSLAWFGVIIWVISTAGPVVYPVFGFLLALRLVAMKYKKRQPLGILNITSGLLSADLLVGIALTVHAFLNLDRVTNYSVWQALTGLSLAGTIISGLLVVYTFIREGITTSNDKKTKRNVWMALYSSTAWTIAWFGITIWLISSHPSYVVSALLLALRLGGSMYKKPMQWAQKALLNVALLVYVVLVENSTTYSPWAALVAMASIGLILDALSAVMLFMIDANGKFSLQWNTSGIVKAVRKAEKAFLSGNNIQMRTPTTGLRQK